MSRHKILSDEQLERLSTKRLLNVLRIARAIESSISCHAGPRCCEECHEYIGDDYERDVIAPRKAYTVYKETIKKILATRKD